MGCVMGSRLFLVLGLVVGLAFPASAAEIGIKPAPKPGAWDYLALSLSWSPAYCASGSGKHDHDQCGGTTKYGFVAHGLWPVFPRGAGKAPHGCGGDNASLTDKAAEKALPIMPGAKLINHEWEKHGTCFGGDATTYFGKVRSAWDKIKMPARFKEPGKETKMSAEQIRAAFVEANPGLPARAVAVICQKPHGKPAADPALILREVRVCFDKSLNFRDCGSQVKDHCKADAVVVGK